MAAMIRLHNTLSGRVEEFVPIEPGSVKLYTCGPTVYDFPHIGNWRSYVFEDLLKRLFLYRGFRVLHVMNITDVDDKTIRGANAKGVGLEDYTKPFIEAFARDRDVLNILPADTYPRATAHIEEMVGLIEILLEKGFAYRKDGSIYFAIDKFPPYGRLSKINLEDLRPGSHADADEYAKESVHDFALWKAPKEGEPVWETRIGPGRPGWHIECSAMSSKYLGRTFDIHCGGVDNIFPHHENEIAQSEAANGVKFVNYWIHGHHLVVDGEKMSKSKGNFYTLTDILARGYDPREVRFLLLTTHYRKMLNFTFEALVRARASRNRIRDFLVDLRGPKHDGPIRPEVADLINAARENFIASLEDDLNISEALASLFSLIEKANSLASSSPLTQGDALALIGFINEIDNNILGIEPTSVRVRADSVTLKSSADNVQLKTVEDKISVAEYLNIDVSEALDPISMNKVNEREAARNARDFKRADEIRDELLKAGIVLEDTKDGVRWKKTGPPKA
jgi:cysteinyl-tRNA synthetase